MVSRPAGSGLGEVERAVEDALDAGVESVYPTLLIGAGRGRLVGGLCARDPPAGEELGKVSDAAIASGGYFRSCKL